MLVTLVAVKKLDNAREETIHTPELVDGSMSVAKIRAEQQEQLQPHDQFGVG